ANPTTPSAANTPSPPPTAAGPSAATSTTAVLASIRCPRPQLPPSNSAAASAPHGAASAAASVPAGMSPAARDSAQPTHTSSPAAAPASAPGSPPRVADSAPNAPSSATVTSTPQARRTSRVPHGRGTAPWPTSSTTSSYTGGGVHSSARCSTSSAPSRTPATARLVLGSSRAPSALDSAQPPSDSPCPACGSRVGSTRASGTADGTARSTWVPGAASRIRQNAPLRPVPPTGGAAVLRVTRPLPGSVLARQPGQGHRPLLASAPAPHGTAPQTPRFRGDPQLGPPHLTPP